MTGNRNLDIALRIQADVASAQRALKGINDELGQTGEQGRAAETGLEATATALTGVEDAAQGAATAIDRAAQEAQATATALDQMGGGGRTAATGLTTVEAAAEGATTAIDRAALEAMSAVTAFDQVGVGGRAAATGLTAVESSAEATSSAIDRVGQEAETSAVALEQVAVSSRSAASGAATAGDAANNKLTPALSKAELAAKRANISLGQYNMAMRQLPMQMTDIFTGLATGQSPFMVLMQQGGQLKDSFGGILPAAKAVGSAVMGLVNPYTLAAAAAAALAVAWYQGDQEGRKFAETAALIGEYGGITATKLHDLSAEFDNLEGVTQGKAAAALNSIASSGQFTAEQLELVGKAALQMEETTGRAIEDTTAEFAKLRQDPVKALLELNDKYHFLTQATYDQVKALIEQGKQQEAVTLAMQTYAGVIDDRTSKITENLGYIEKAWRGIKNAAAEGWDALLGIGRDSTTTDKLKGAQQRLEFLRNNRGNDRAGWSPYAEQQAEAQLAALQKQVEQEQAAAASKAKTNAAATVDSAQVKAQEEAQKKRDQERKSFFDAETRYLNDSQKKKREIAAVNDQVTRGIISQEEATKRIGQIEADYAAKSQKRGVQRKTDAQRAQEDAQRELEDLTKQVALTSTLEDGQKRVTEEDRISYEITAGKFRLVSQGTKDQLLQQAKLLDAKRAEREETEKAKAAYDSLKNSLQTPIDAAVARVTQQMQDLQKAMGLMSPDEASRRQQQIIDQSITALPNIGAEALRQYGVGNDENDRLAQMRADLEAEYKARSEIINAAKQQENADQKKWNKASEELEAQHQAQLTALTQAENMMRLGQISSAFNSMAEIAKSFGGEQSKTYQAMFALSKGFAAAQAAVALAQNVAEASKLGWPANIPAIAAALAQGATIAQLLSGANFSASGYAGGGQIRGAGTPTSDSIPIWASDQEFMVRAASATQPGAVDFLNDFNQRGMVALHDWARGFADGGQITAMAEPNANISDNAALMRSVNNNSLRLYNLFDRDALAEMLVNHPAFDKRVVVVAGENGGAIRSTW
ncbi:MAG: DNA-binding protein [Pseudoxanthomonas spadix]|nr:MAG: DNA-binding protein [Pseudoxanthomonas spadix]